MTRALRFQATVSLADVVLAGNQFLASAACQRTSHRKVHIIPTCVDATRYQPAEHQEHRPTRLVWIGSSSTYPTLEAAREVLEAIGRGIPNTVLRVICDRFPRYKHLRVEPAPWSEQTETQALGEADIGISWVPDDLWSRGKCGLKVLQYMAAGLPVLASPVGVHRDMVSREFGFLPASTEEWVTQTRQLVDDHRLRHAMGRQGRDQLDRFDVQTWGPVVADCLREAAARV